MEFLSGAQWDEFGLLGTAFRTCGWLPLFAAHPCWYALLIFKSCHCILSLFFRRLDCWLWEPGVSGLALSHCGVGQKETWPKVVSLKIGGRGDIFAYFSWHHILFNWLLSLFLVNEMQPHQEQFQARPAVDGPVASRHTRRPWETCGQGALCISGRVLFSSSDCLPCCVGEGLMCTWAR